MSLYKPTQKQLVMEMLKAAAGGWVTDREFNQAGYRRHQTYIKEYEKAGVAIERGRDKVNGITVCKYRLVGR